MNYTVRLVSAGLLLAASLLHAETPSSLLVASGTFDAPPPSWKFAAGGWKKEGYFGSAVPPNEVLQVSQDQNAFLRIISGAGPEKGEVRAVLDEEVLLNPQWQKLSVRYRARLTNFQPGSEKWHRARIEISYLDENDQDLKTYLSVPIEPSESWTPGERTVPIPAGAHSVKVKFGFWRSQGQLDLDDLELIPVIKQ